MRNEYLENFIFTGYNEGKRTRRKHRLKNRWASFKWITEQGKRKTLIRTTKI